MQLKWIELFASFDKVGDACPGRGNTPQGAAEERRCCFCNEGERRARQLNISGGVPADEAVADEPAAVIAVYFLNAEETALK